MHVASSSKLVLCLRIGIVLGLLVAIGYSYGITLWDWLKLLVVPTVIAAGGLWFNRQQRERELEIARQQREQELGIAERRTQDEALQAYLDQMSGMLIPSQDQPSLYKARPGDSLSSVARARTLTVLPRLDGERKARVVQFLYESGLFAKGREVLYLRGADLSGADLVRAPDLVMANLLGANLRGANLYNTNLSGAHLSGANLSEAWLGNVNLYGARLFRANLYGTHFFQADLSHAGLDGADLRGANLLGANLDGAHLSEVNLSNAKEWTVEQLLAAASVEGATMPDGQTLKSEDNPDGPTLKEWLKSKRREEDG